MQKQLSLTILLVLIFTLVAPAPQVQAAAPNINHYLYKDEAAIASYSATTDRCIYLVSAVAVGTMSTKDGPGAPAAGITVNVDINQYDICQGLLLSGAYGFAALPSDAFQIDKQLTSAHLQSSVPMFNFTTGTAFSVAVDLTWTGVGESSRDRSVSHYQFPGCKLTTRFNGLFRSAEVTGSLSDGATDYAANGSSLANLQSVKGGYMLIGCG